MMILLIIHQALIFCLAYLFLQLEVRVEGFYYWNFTHTSTYGIHPLVSTNKYLCLLQLLPQINTLNFLYGLAYYLSNDDYLVVFGSCEHDVNYEPVSSSIDLEIFSLRANKWKQIEFDSHFPYRYTASSEGGIGNSSYD